MEKPQFAMSLTNYFEKINDETLLALGFGLANCLRLLLHG